MPGKNLVNGYIGWVNTRAERDLHKKVLEDCGIKIRIRVQRDRYEGKPYSYSLWCDPKLVIRARDIRKGIKVGLTMLGDPFDIALGVRAALIFRQGAKHGIPGDTNETHRGSMALRQSRSMRRLQSCDRMVDHCREATHPARNDHRAIAADSLRELPERRGI